MSSLLDVPVHLALMLSLAASTVANEPPGASPASELTVPASAAALVAQPPEGPFRFREGIWLRALKESLPEDAHDFSASIFCTSGGRYYVPAAAERRLILDARRDSALASRAALAFARSNARALRAALRRAPTAGELYIAHLFGPEVAASLLELVRSKPDEAAATHLPELARAAPDLLGAPGASPTLAQLYAQLTSPLDQRSRGDAILAAPPAREDQPRAVLDLKPTIAQTTGREPGSRAPRAQAIAWQTEVSASKSSALHQ